MTKKEAQKKLLKGIREIADALTEGVTCGHGSEAYEVAIMEMLVDRLKRDHYHGVMELDDYLPNDGPLSSKDDDLGSETCVLYKDLKKRWEGSL